MSDYDKTTFEKLIHVIRSNDKDAEKWLVDNGHRELKEFWDAYEGMEPSFKWLMENGYRHLAAVVDAMNENDKAKAFLLSSGHRELAAFVEAANGSKSAVSWLLKYKHFGWVMVAKVLFEKNKKKEKSFLWSFLNFGNPFR